MNISVTHTQPFCRINTGKIKKLATYLLGKAADRSGITWGNISIVLTDNVGIRKVNSSSLGHDYATDVISFNFEPMPGDPEGATDGEIIISIECACQRGPAFKGPNHELALYLAHGCDHLSGAEDNTTQQRQQMRRRELRWLNDAELQGLNFNLVVVPE